MKQLTNKPFLEHGLSIGKSQLKIFYMYPTAHTVDIYRAIASNIFWLHSKLLVNSFVWSLE
jgi:hypothetical protein